MIILSLSLQPIVFELLAEVLEELPAEVLEAIIAMPL
jgi:hypothetical protein